MSDVRVAVLRAAQGRAAMLSVTEAARLLGFAEAHTDGIGWPGAVPSPTLGEAAARGLLEVWS